MISASKKPLFVLNVSRFEEVTKILRSFVNRTSFDFTIAIRGFSAQRLTIYGLQNREKDGKLLFKTF
jgi:hypothetical protein